MYIYFHIRKEALEKDGRHVEKNIETHPKELPVAKSGTLCSKINNSSVGL